MIKDFIYRLKSKKNALKSSTEWKYCQSGFN